MLKMTAMSLLLGAVALIAGLQLFLLPPTVTAGQQPIIAWDATTADVHSGTGIAKGQVLHLQLSDAGRAVVTLPTPQLEAASDAFIHLAVTGSAQDLSILITWTTAQTGNNILSYTLEDKSRASVWLATRELRGWSTEVTSLSLELAGQPGDEVTISDFSIFPASLSRQLRAIYSDWTSFVPWQRSAMNSHTGVTRVASFYPAPLSATLCILSLLAYGLLLLLFRTNTRFNWGVVALIFLACWISLDLAWQNRLFKQLAETYGTFSGKTTPEKLAVGPDAELVGFITEVKQQLQPVDARVFVGSTDNYLGLRGAYYLYPFNVYWTLHGPELPDPEYIHSGDYVVLVEPTAVGFDPLASTLLTPGNTALRVQPVFSGRVGSLFRVK